jgi:hypothetical protein
MMVVTIEAQSPKSGKNGMPVRLTYLYESVVPSAERLGTRAKVLGFTERDLRVITKHK